MLWMYILTGRRSDMIDNRGKLFGRINIIDLCVILVIIAAIGVTVFKFKFSAHSDVSASNGTVTYTVTTNGVRDFTVKQFKVGDKMYDKENDKYMGDVVSVSSEPAMDYITCADGSIKYVVMPERYDLTVVVSSPARINGEEIITSGGKQIFLNQKGMYYTQTVMTNSRITAVEATVE